MESEPKTKRKLKPVHCLALTVLVMAPVCALILIYLRVQNPDRPIYDKVADVPNMPVAVVFGAGINSLEMKDRVDTAVALYKGGKVLKLLMTGDNGRMEYNEPIAMKQAAVAQGVPDKDVACDYAGFRTYDSVYRAREIFDVQRAVLVSQRYHLPRALFLAENLGINAVGMDAGVHNYRGQAWYDLREIGSTEFAWFDLVLERKPKYLGRKEHLFDSDSEKSATEPPSASTAAPSVDEADHTAKTTAESK